MSLLEWSHRVSEVRERKDFARDADGGERAAMTDLLGNADCLELSAWYSIIPKRDGRFAVTGRVTARLAQICGVTLEPIEQVIDEPLEVVFDFGASGDSDLGAVFDPLGEDPPEPIVNNRLQVGQIVAEIVASAADPFPRAEDVTLEVSEVESGSGDDVAGEGPFAALGGLAKGNGERGE